MNKKIITGLIVLVLIGVSVAFSFSDKTPSKLKVGVIAPLSGQYGALGESIRDAITLSLEKDKNVEVVFEDDAFDAKKGVSAYQKLTSIDKVNVLINVTSPTINSIQSLVNKDNILTFHLSESGVKKDDSVFQVMPFSYPIFTGIGKEASNRFNRIAVVYGGDLDIFGTDAEYFKKGVGQNKVMGDFKVSGKSDMRTEAAKILAFNPDALTVIVDKETGIKLLKAISEQKGTKDVKVICDANLEFVAGDYVKALGSDTMINGCISANLPSNTVQSFKDEFKKRFNYEPLFLSDYGYDVGEMIKKLEGVSKKDWKTTVASMNFEGVSGKVAFDKEGTRPAEYELHVYQNGKFVKLVK